MTLLPELVISCVLQMNNVFFLISDKALSVEIPPEGSTVDLPRSLVRLHPSLHSSPVSDPAVAE